jgi:hypothetical protein
VTSQETPFFDNNVVMFWDRAPRIPHVNRLFGELITSIFKAENLTSKKPSCNRWLGSSSERSVNIHITLRYIPEDGNIHNCSYENLKSYKTMLVETI